MKRIAIETTRGTALIPEHFRFSRRLPPDASYPMRCEATDARGITTVIDFPANVFSGHTPSPDELAALLRDTAENLQEMAVRIERGDIKI